MIRYTKVKVIKITETQDETLKKMKSYKINVSKFIRDAISEKINKEYKELKLKKEETTVISGIGCTGRAAGYFNFSTVHGLHGRAVPLAEGIKLAKPKMNVIVLSGDGDLVGIGGNHLLHACKRDTNITVICNNNYIYSRWNMD